MTRWATIALLCMLAVTYGLISNDAPQWLQTLAVVGCFAFAAPLCLDALKQGYKLIRALTGLSNT